MLERFPQTVLGDIPLDTDNEDQLVLSWDVERAILLGQTLKADLLTLLVTVLLDVLFGTLEDNTTLLLLSLSRVSCSSQDSRHTDDMAVIIQTRKMVNLATASTVSSRKSGVMHHKSPSVPSCVFMKCRRTFFFFSSSAERSSLAFSWLLRFFNSVSGTRIWSAVGTLLF